MCAGISNLAGRLLVEICGCYWYTLGPAETLENSWNPWKFMFKSWKVNEWWLSSIWSIYIYKSYICVCGPQQQHQEYITSSKKGITCHCCWKLSFMDSQPIWYEWFRTKRAPWFPFFFKDFPQRVALHQSGAWRGWQYGCETCFLKETYISREKNIIQEPKGWTKNFIDYIHKHIFEIYRLWHSCYSQINGN